MQRVLLVDDEPAIVAAVRERLEREGIAVDFVLDGETALTQLDAVPYTLVLLDIGLPGIDGFETLRRMRLGGHEQPVIILSARGDEIDRVLGLEIGADDYVTKPFSTRELAARVRVLLRRIAEVAALRAQLSEPAAPSGLLELDIPRRRAQFAGVALDLRPREFDLLAFLVQHPDHVFSREELLRAVWGQADFLDDRTVDVHIRRLRAHFAAVDPTADPIQTERGVGYRFVAL